jgi:KaiC/GvpD/RAD55 family RecA-like ATPase
LSSSERFRIPFLSELVPGGIKAGTILLVEFDPESQWFAVATSMTAKVIQSGGNVSFQAGARPPEDIENDLSALGVDVPKAFGEGHLYINDWYSATLRGGRIEPLAPGAGHIEHTRTGSKYLSLKVQDLSLEFLKASKSTNESPIYSAAWPAGSLNIADSFSIFLRFNEEKAFAEYLETRQNPQQRKMQRITIRGLVRGLHSDWFYKRMEAAFDGVVDLQVMEREGKARNFLRDRGIRGLPHDSAWHEIEMRPNGEAVLT